VAKFVDDIAQIYRYSDTRDRELDSLPCGVLHPDSDWRLWWDVCVLLLVCWYAAIVPFRLSFDPTQSSWEVILDWVAVGIFTFDMLINFSTAFRDRLGSLVSDRAFIANKYFTGWFWLDFLATVPFDAILSGTAVSESAGQINRLLRLARIARLARLFRLLRLFPRIVEALEGSIRLNPSLIRFFTSILYLLYMQHLVACGYYYVSLAIYGGTTDCVDVASSSVRRCYSNECLAMTCEADLAINGLDNATASASARILQNSPSASVEQLDFWLPHPQLASLGLFSQYSISFWWAIQSTVGVGAGIVPRTPGEVWYSTFAVMVGIILYSIIIGSASSALSNIDSAATA